MTSQEAATYAASVLGYSKKADGVRTSLAMKELRSTKESPDNTFTMISENNTVIQ